MQNKKSPPPSQQQGFALLTVLMIVVLITMMGSQLLYEQHTHIKRSSHMLHQAQSFSVQWGVESWVKTGLKLDQDNNNYDALEEEWRSPFGPIPYEGGEVSARMIDLNSRLNVNNVLDPKPKQRQIWQNILKRYASQNELSTRFSAVIIDWVDKDDMPSSSGAESNAYLLLQPAYSAADQPMVMLSELKLLEDLTRIENATWTMLQNDLTALPNVTVINVNTAEERVLLALADWLEQTVVSAWLTERLSQPAQKIEDFIDFLVQNTGVPRADIKKDLPTWLVGVQSDYFLLHTQVDYGESQQGISAIFFRALNNNQTNNNQNNGNDVRLVQRWLSLE